MLKEKWGIFKRHFKENFLKASAVFLAWFIVYNIPHYLPFLKLKIVLDSPSGILELFFSNIFSLFFIAAFSYVLWIAIILIFDGKLNKTYFFKTAAKQSWFLVVLFVFEALMFFNFNILTLTGGSYWQVFDFMTYFNLALGAVKIFFICVFLITARMGVSLKEGLKEKIKDNWPVFPGFVGGIIVFYIILLTFVWILTTLNMSRPGGIILSALMVFASFVTQYGFYVIAPFIALPFVAAPSEKRTE